MVEDVSHGMVSESEVKALISEDLGEQIDSYHDYGPSEMVRAFWVGYRRGVAESRPEFSGGEGDPK